MSSSASTNLISTAILLSAETHAALCHFSRKNATINTLSKSVNAIEEAFGRFEKKDADLLGEKEVEKLGEITKALIHNLNAILPILNSAIRKGAISKREPALPTRFTPLMAENRQAIASSVALLNALLLKVEGRRPTIMPQLLNGSRGLLDVPKQRANRRAIKFNYRKSGLDQGFSGFTSGEHVQYSGHDSKIISLWPRNCILIMLFFAAFVALSCFLGVYFTINKSYGYSMGDAFTLAGWVVAVGAFISSAILACHHPRCKCWDSSKYSELPRHDDYELQTLAELPG